MITSPLPEGRRLESCPDINFKAKMIPKKKKLGVILAFTNKLLTQLFVRMLIARSSHCRDNMFVSTPY